MEIGHTYEVHVRMVANRPDWTAVRRLQFAGIRGDRSRWRIPGHEWQLTENQQVVELTIDQIAGIKEMAA